jgi:hypothetical protein
VGLRVPSRTLAVGVGEEPLATAVVAMPYARHAA